MSTTKSTINCEKMPTLEASWFEHGRDGNRSDRSIGIYDVAYIKSSLN